MMNSRTLVCLSLLVTCIAQPVLAQLSAGLEANPKLAPMKTSVGTLPHGMHVKAEDILGRMHASIDDMQAHTYRLMAEERRLGDVYHRGEMKIAVQQKPLNIKLEILKPNEGAVVEYHAGKDKDEAVVTPKKWLPAVKFKRNIHGTLLRPGHYGINETSLTHIDEIIARIEEGFTQRGISEKGIRYWGSLQVNGVLCHKIELMDHDYRIVDYTVKHKDDVLKIASRQMVNPYKIRELNPEIKTYFDLTPGQVIQIPSSFARRCIIYVDVQEFLPRKLEIFDEKGWFERYSFYDIQATEG